MIKVQNLSRTFGDFATGSTLKDMHGFQMVMNFLVLPTFFLSGALYPLDNLPKALVALTHIDPMTYGVAAPTQGSTSASSDAPKRVRLMSTARRPSLMVIGAWRFSKIEV
jgi:ABC-2 type transport system permease protein